MHATCVLTFKFCESVAYFSYKQYKNGCIHVAGQSKISKYTQKVYDLLKFASQLLKFSKPMTLAHTYYYMSYNFGISIKR